MDKRDFQLRARFRHQMRLAGIEDGSALLVAVSGGCDSVSLLHLCFDEAATRSWRLVVGHVDHALRPDSREDAAWVEQLARDLGLEFRLSRVPPETWAPFSEEAARLERRRRLRAMAEESGARAVLLGHTLDDQAETVLMNLLRGSHLRGLTGMRARRRRWVRPLLGVTRDELRGFAERRGLRWREDSTNQDVRLLRNRIRRRLMPLLKEEFAPGAPRVLARLADSLVPVRRFLQSEAAKAWQECCLEVSPSRIRLERARLATYHQAVVEEVLRRASYLLRASARDLKRAPLSALASALLSGRPGPFSFPAGITAALNHREVRLDHPKGKKP